MTIYIYIRLHPAGMSVAHGKVSSCSNSSSLMTDLNGILLGVKEELIPVVMTIDPMPQAIIKVLSCECATNCCIVGVHAINAIAISHSPAERESNTIRNTAYV